MKKILLIMLVLFIFASCNTSNITDENALYKINPFDSLTEICSTSDSCQMIDLSIIPEKIIIHKLISQQYTHILLASSEHNPTTLMVIFIMKDGLTNSWKYHSHYVYQNSINDSSNFSAIINDKITVFITNHSNTKTLSYKLDGEFIEERDSFTQQEENHSAIQIKQIIPFQDSFLTIETESINITNTTAERLISITKYSLENEIIWKIPTDLITDSNEFLMNPTIQLIDDKNFILDGYKYEKNDNQTDIIIDKNIYYTIYNSDGNFEEKGTISLNNQTLGEIIPSNTSTNVISVLVDNQFFEFDLLSNSILSNFQVENQINSLLINGNYITVTSKQNQSILNITNRITSTFETYNLPTTPQLFYNTHANILFVEANRLFLFSHQFPYSEKIEYDSTNNILQINNLSSNCKNNTVCYSISPEKLYEWMDFPYTEDSELMISILSIIELKNGRFFLVLRSEPNSINQEKEESINILLFDKDWNCIRKDFYPKISDFYFLPTIFKIKDTIYFYGKVPDNPPLFIKYDSNGNLIKKEYFNQCH